MAWPWLTLIFGVLALAILVQSRKRIAEVKLAAKRDLEKLQAAREEEAARAQAREEALFDSMAEGVVVLDDTGRIQLANRAFTTMFNADSRVKGRTLLEALRQHQLAEIPDQFDAANRVLGKELKLAGGGEIEVNAAAILDGGGRRRGAIMVFHDLTRMKKLERARQDFVANVSHELRTPLSLIKGYVETLLNGARNDPEVATRFLQIIDRNSERLTLLIQDLLTISEIEGGRLKLDLQLVKLRELVDKVLADFRSPAESRKITTVNECPDLRVTADPARLEQVLGNLVDNATKYGRDGGHVTVSARICEPGRVEVAVRDDGPGIPRESLDRVFERFYRVDKARSRDQGGTGLGLSIVKHIVQSHGGKVWVTSEPGAGATFFFTLSAAS